jgi:anti-sigma-K factor RskA
MTSQLENHDVLREQAALYAIGALTAPERAAFEAHLKVCASCAAEVAAFLPVGTALAQAVPLHDPPSGLRARVLADAQREETASPRATRAFVPFVPWLATAAMLLLTVGLGFYVGQLRDRVRILEVQLRDALVRVDDGERRVAVALRSAAAAEAPLAVLTAPDLQRIDLVGQPAAPRASARAFWSRSRGLVLTGSNLPPLPAGRVYQLWFVTARAPISAGLLKPDEAGRLSAVLDTPANLPVPVALAVTIEPEGGRPAPTGDKYLVGLTH